MFTNVDRLYLLMQFNRINAKLDALLEGGVDEDTKLKLQEALKQQEEHMADLNQAVTELADKVTAQTTVVEGVKTTIDGLVTQLNAQAGDLDAAGEQAAADKLREIATALQANTDTLALAVAKNTDAHDEVHAAQM